MLSPCIICYRRSDGEVEGDVRETLKMFFPLLERYLKVDTADEEQLPGPLFEKLINAGMVSCAECSKVVKSFCELYYQMKSIQTELNSGLMTLHGRICLAEMDYVKKKEFGNCAKQLVDIGDPAGAEESIGSIFQFKRDLISKCGRKIKNTLDDTCLPRGNKDPLDLNHSSPVFRIPDDTSVSSPRSKIFKVESLEIDQVEDLDTSDTRTFGSQNKHDFNEQRQIEQETGKGSSNLNKENEDEDNDASGSEYQMSDINSDSEYDEVVGDSEARATSSTENTVGEDLKGQTPFMPGKMPPPVECCLPGESTSTEGEGMPRSIVDPETGKYKCLICVAKFDQLKGIQRHYQSLHSNIRYKCTLCNQHFKRKDYYKSHYQNVHVPKGSLKPKTRKHNIKCPVCGKTFLSNRDLCRHQRNNHIGGIMYQCPRCNKQFSQKDAMMRHQQYSCEQPVTKPNSQNIQANQSKTTSNWKEEDLKTARRDTSADYLECAICGKKFVLKSDLKAHRRNVHAEYPEMKV